jgi:hypothetical protein
MMSNILRFTPKQVSNEEFMRKYREECARTGSPVDPNKCNSGDPGTITTPDGDVLYVGEGPWTQT